jgi:hypothetical protein
LQLSTDVVARRSAMPAAAVHAAAGVAEAPKAGVAAAERAAH